MSTPLKNSVAAIFNLLIKQISQNYIAGPDVSDAIRLGQQLSGLGYWVSLGYWDSHKDGPEVINESYTSSIDFLNQLPGENYLSVKLPALHKSLLRTDDLLAMCSAGTHIHFDSLGPEYADTIYTLANELVQQHPNRVGVTLPAKWQRSPGDARDLSKLAMNIRVVQGQWADPDNAVADPRATYLKIIRILAGRHNTVRVATHNYSLARRTIKMLTEAGTPCELELLYGLPVNGLIELAKEFATPVRVYIAFGHAYLPYAIGSVRKHPEIVLRLLKELYKGNYAAGFSPMAQTAPGGRPG